MNRCLSVKSDCTRWPPGGQHWVHSVSCTQCSPSGLHLLQNSNFNQCSPGGLHWVQITDFTKFSPYGLHWIQDTVCTQCLPCGLHSGHITELWEHTVGIGTICSHITYHVTSWWCDDEVRDCHGSAGAYFHIHCLITQEDLIPYS